MFCSSPLLIDDSHWSGGLSETAGQQPCPKWTVHVVPWSEVVALSPHTFKNTLKHFLCRRYFIFSVQLQLFLLCLDTYYLLQKVILSLPSWLSIHYL